MNKLSALMIGAAMILGTAFAAQNAPKTTEKSTTTKKVKKHHTKTKKSAKPAADTTATPAPAK
jgi:hypothetical protein